MVVTLGRRHAGLVEQIDEFGVRHCMVPGVNTPDPQVSYERAILHQNTRVDVMWPDVEIGETWRYKCGNCGTAYHHKVMNDDTISCNRCGDDLRKPDWGARRRLQNLLESDLNDNGEGMSDVGNLLVQSLLDTGEAYLVRYGNYHTDESGNVTEKPAELNEPERPTGTQGTQSTLNYWVPCCKFVKTVNEWRHLLGLPSCVVFCVYHRSNAYVGKSECPECGTQMIDAYGYIRTPMPDDARPPDNGVNMEYFGEREVLGCSGWYCQIKDGAGHKTDNYEYLGDYSQVGVETVNSIRTLLNEKFFGPLAEGMVGRDTGFTLNIPLAVDELQGAKEKGKVLDMVIQYKNKGYHYRRLIADDTFMIAAPSEKTDDSA